MSYGCPTKGSLPDPIYAHVNPYGVFRLDMDERLALDEEAVG